MSKPEILANIKTLMRNAGYETETRVAFPWLNNRVPLMGDTATPAVVVRRLSELHSHLGGNWMDRLSKRETPLTFDMKIGQRTVIDVDLLNRFTSARLTSLDFYHGTHHELDIRHYRNLCNKYHEEADRANQSKTTPEFPFPGGRNAQAAYFDFAKDLLVPAHGFQLIRVPAPQGEMTSALLLKLKMIFGA